MAEKIGEAYVDITARLNDYEKQLKVAQKDLAVFSSRTSTETKKISSSFSNVAKGAVAAYAAIKAGQLVYNKFIKPASDLQEINNKFAVTFKDVSQEAKKASDVLRNSFGVSRAEANKLLSDTGDLLTGFGLTGKEALKVSENVNQLAIDLASFTNIEGGAERASKALTSALLGEREQAKQLGIVIRENDIQARLAAKGQDKLTGNALLQAKAMATLEIATEQSKNAIGDFARSQDSFANIQRRIQSRLADTSAEIGSILIPAMENLGIAFLGTSKDGSVFIDLIKGITSVLADAISGFAIFAGKIEQFAANRAVDKGIEQQKQLRKEYKETVKELEKRGITQDQIQSNFISQNAEENLLIGKAIKLKKEQQTQFEENQKAIERAQGANETLDKIRQRLNTTEDISAKAREREKQKLNENTSAINNNTNAKQKNAEATEKQISALEIFNNMTSVATQLTSGLGDIFQLQAENRLTELENEKQQQLDKIAADYETEQQQIEQTISNEEEKNAALKALDEKRARDEKTIEEKIDKDKRKIQRQAAKDQKALKIAETIIAGASASINAYNSLAVIPIIGPALGAAAAAAVAALTAVKVGLIQATPLPALAQGGIATAPTTAIIGEAGSEAVFPLEGPQGQKTRAMFANDLITAIANQQEQFLSTSTIDSATAGQPMRLTVNIGSKNLYDDITTATQNKEILIDSGAIIES